MKSITKNELVTMVDGVSGTTFISVDLVSEAKMRKTGNPYVGAKKLVKLNGMVGYDYGNAVNNQLKREGKESTFVAKPRAWGERKGNWVVHKDKHYLSVKVQSSADPVYTFNDVPVDTAKLKPFMTVSKKPMTQAELDNEVVVRDVKLDNIRLIRLQGEEYKVI